MSMIPRAFRFRHPIFDSAAEVDSNAAPVPGLTLDTHGHVEMVEGDAAIRQALLLLLSTVPGERVMRPSYGCELYRLAFAVNDATSEGLAMHYVRRAIEAWEPRVELTKVDAQRDRENPGRLNIAVDYRVRRTAQNARLDFPVSLNHAVYE